LRKGETNFCLSALAIYIITGALLFLFPCVCIAQTAKTPETMDMAALESLIKRKDRRCLISVLASWCGPCIKELPAFIKLYDKYKSQGVEIIAISVDFGGPSAMQPLMEKLNINFPVYWVGEKALDIYEIRAIPMTFVVRDGKIVEKITGIRPEAFWDKTIRKLLE
jgi:thiol-disulfide isomerase/thioredoxin